MRWWIAIALIVLGVASAKAITVQQQIIIFGGQTSASGSGGSGCTNKLDFSAICNSQYLTIVH